MYQVGNMVKVTIPGQIVVQVEGKDAEVAPSLLVEGEVVGATPPPTGGVQEPVLVTTRRSYNGHDTFLCPVSALTPIATRFRTIADSSPTDSTS
jgi:hypothetical protein